MGPYDDPEDIYAGGDEDDGREAYPHESTD